MPVAPPVAPMPMMVMAMTMVMPVAVPIRRTSSLWSSTSIEVELRGFRFPPDVITIAVRWYLRYALSYRDVEELLAERYIE